MKKKDRPAGRFRSGDRAELTVIEGENHLINRRRDQVVARTVSFFRSVFSV